MTSFNTNIPSDIRKATSSLSQETLFDASNAGLAHRAGAEAAQVARETLAEPLVLETRGTGVQDKGVTDKIGLSQVSAEAAHVAQEKLPAPLVLETRGTGSSIPQQGHWQELASENPTGAVSEVVMGGTPGQASAITSAATAAKDLAMNVAERASHAASSAYETVKHMASQAGEVLGGAIKNVGSTVPETSDQLHHESQYAAPDTLNADRAVISIEVWELEEDIARDRAAELAASVRPVTGVDAATQYNTLAAEAQPTAAIKLKENASLAAETVKEKAAVTATTLKENAPIVAAKVQQTAASAANSAANMASTAAVAVKENAPIVAAKAQETAASAAITAVNVASGAANVASNVASDVATAVRENAPIVAAKAKESAVSTATTLKGSAITAANLASNAATTVKEGAVNAAHQMSNVASNVMHSETVHNVANSATHAAAVVKDTAAHAAASVKGSAVNAAHLAQSAALSAKQSTVNAASSLKQSSLNAAQGVANLASSAKEKVMPHGPTANEAAAETLREVADNIDSARIDMEKLGLQDQASQPTSTITGVTSVPLQPQPYQPLEMRSSELNQFVPLTTTDALPLTTQAPKVIFETTPLQVSQLELTPATEFQPELAEKPFSQINEQGIFIASRPGELI